MPDSTSLGITYPVAVDLVKSGSSGAKLADDLKTMAFTTDQAIGAAVNEAFTDQPLDGAVNLLRVQEMKDYYGPISTSGKGAIALRFDHGLSNFNTKIRPLLEARNIKYSLALSSRNFNSGENAGVTAAMVNGWALAEVGNHGANQHQDESTIVGLTDQIVTGKAELEAALPSKRIFGYAVPGTGGTGQGGFGGGATSEAFSGTRAGELILANHAVSTGSFPGTARRVMDGNVRQGMAHFTIEAQTVARIKTEIDNAISNKTGNQLMMHPSLIDTPGYLTTAQLTEVLDYIVTKRNTGELVVLSPYEMMVADARIDGVSAIADANAKYGGLPGRVAANESKNVAQDIRLNVTEANDREFRETAPRPTPDGFKIRDKTGAAAFQVTEEGSLGVGASRIEQIPADDGVAYRIRDKTGAVAFAIASNGTHSAGSGSPVTSVRVIIGAGQSNMTGVGTPVGPEYDFDDPRIFQYGSGASSITAAAVPLDMRGNSSGLSPLTTFAREYVKALPPGTIVLLVPAAHGGTGFSTAAPLTWDSTTVGGLYDDMVTQTLEAVTAAQEQWGVVPTVSALLWHQGEGDGALTTAAYAAHLDALIVKVRTDISVPDLPVVVGQMSSDWVAANPGPLRVQAAHINTPARIARTAFAASMPDTGREADLVHFGRAGIEALGKSMLKALPVALANQEGVLVMPPTALHAVKAAGVVTAYWEAPLCRATGYTIEYRIGAGAWTAATGRAIAVLREQALPSDATEARVATINPAGNSRFTQPASVQGA